MFLRFGILGWTATFTFGRETGTTFAGGTGGSFERYVEDTWDYDDPEDRFGFH